MLRVGLTGGIASGKSQVRRRLAAGGMRTLDLDEVSRSVMAPGGAAYEDVVAAFGPRVLAPDGTIDRRALADIVFADGAARLRLEALVHPRIRDAEAALLAAAGEEAVAVVDAALLVEAGSHLRYDRLIVAWCEPQEQLCRLMARDAISEAAARARIDAQMPADDKRLFAHFVVDTSDTPADTEVRTDAVAEELRALARRPPGRARIAVERAAAMVERGPREGPRGLTPWGLVGEIAASGTLDLARLARALRPPYDGPWYQAAVASRPDAPPETLAVPVALWSEGRRPADEEYTAGSAAALARLTHRDGVAIAAAVLAALAVQHALAAPDSSSLRHGVRGWALTAASWTGAEPPSAIVDTVLAAAAHPGDREAAARAAQVAGGLPPLARALAGGPVAAPAPKSRLERIARILHPPVV